MSLKNNFILITIFLNLTLIACKGTVDNRNNNQFISERNNLTRTIDSLNIDLNNDNNIDKISVIENNNDSNRTIIIEIIDNKNNHKIISKNNKLISCSTCGYQNGDPYIGIDSNGKQGFSLELEYQTLNFIYQNNNIYLNKIDILEVKPTGEGIEDNHIIINLDDDSKIELDNLTQDLIYKIISANKKKDNQQCIKSSIFKLPYNKTIDLDNITYSLLNCNIKGVENWLCGESSLRYIPFPKKDNIEVILVPMDCGDFEYRFYMLTIKNNTVMDQLYVEGEWYEPGSNEENTIENTSFSIDKNYIISVVTKKLKEKSIIQKYKINNSGKFEEVKE